MAAVDKTYGDALFSLVTEEDEKEISEEEDTEGDYGAYTAEEILSGEGFKNAEKIIDEIKQQKNAMKKMILNKQL